MAILTDLDQSIVHRLADPHGNAGETVSPAVARLLVNDHLTGLYNRSYFHERIKYELAQVDQKRTLAIFVIDLNNFKQVNDQHGHVAGDHALKVVADVLQAVEVPGSAACRLGGDEFVLLVPNVGREGTLVIQQQLTERISLCSFSTTDGLIVSLSASVGVAIAPYDGVDVESLYHRADRAMYTVKRRMKAGGDLATRWQEIPPLVGREEMLAGMLEAVDKAYQDQGHFLFLSGPPGVGKSRLALEVLKRSRQGAGLVINTQLNRYRPMASIQTFSTELAAALGKLKEAELAAIHPSVDLVLQMGANRSFDEEPAKKDLVMVAEGLRLLMAEVSVVKPILWVLDDVRMADSSTLQILAHLAHELRGVRAAVLAVARTEGAWESEKRAINQWWVGLSALAHCKRIEVPPLERKATIELARWALGTELSEEMRTYLPRLSRGNPLFIMRFAGGSQAAQGQGRRTDLGKLFLTQLQELTEGARSLVSAFAVLGYSADETALRQVCPEVPDEFPYLLEELEQTGWITRADDRLYFAHHLAQETAYEAANPSFRRGLHRLAGYVLSQNQGHTPADIARHFDEGGEWDLAQRCHFEAGQEAESLYASAEAAEHYRRAVNLGISTGRPLTDAPSIALRAASLFYVLWETVSARVMLQYTIQNAADPMMSGRAFTLLARCADEIKAGLPYIEEAVRILRPLGPSVPLAHALTYMLYGQQHQDQITRDEGIAVFQEVTATCEQLDDPVSGMRYALAVACYVNDALPGPEMRSFFTDRLRMLTALKPPDSHNLGWTLLYLATLSRNLGHDHLAVYIIQRALGLNQRVGDQVLSAQLILVARSAIPKFGSFTLSARLLASLELQSKRRPQMRRQWLWWAISHYNYAHRIDEALSAAEQIFSSRNPKASPLAGQCEILLLRHAKGEPIDAATWQNLRQEPTEVYVWALCAQVELVLGNIPQARADLQEAMVDERSQQRAWHLWLKGSMELAGGNILDAAIAFQEAARHRGILYYRAQSHKELAKLLLRGQIGEAEFGIPAWHIKRAHHLFTRIGNEWEVERLRELVPQV
jgi:diguanylate cyclase (GGDEF)-like protein